MPRYAAFLRGVMPTNCKMAELKQAFEAAGYGNVKTVLSSGNVVFDARAAAEATLQRKAESAMRERLAQTFLTIVRPLALLRELLESDPYRKHPPSPGAKRIITFLRQEPASPLSLPIERDGARILGVHGREVFGDYLPTPKGPVFMSMIERMFGKEVTTRTWDTVSKVARG